MRRGVVFAMMYALSLNARAQAPRTTPSGALFSGRDLSLIAGATVISGALTWIDTPVARFFTDTAFHRRHPDFTTAAHRGSLPTETLLMITGGSAYAIARWKESPVGEEVALHATESVAATAMLIQVVRGALGRARPYVVDEEGETRDADPREFDFLHGFTSFNFRSYPSMHAMASMAVASALSQEMRLHDTPHRDVISPALYAAAITPSLARMYLDEHWTSDVQMGIFLGIFAGQKVVWYSHDHPDNFVDRNFLKPRVRITVTQAPGGFSYSILPF